MVDSALCTLLDWNYKDMDMLEGEKNFNISVSINVSGNTSSINTQQSSINFGNNDSVDSNYTFQNVTSPVDATKQLYLGMYNHGCAVVSDSVKPGLPLEKISANSPKHRITLNTLQHEQNNLIEQRIQDRTNTLRTMNVSNPVTPLWTAYNNYAARLFQNVEAKGTIPSVTPGVLSSQISSCMFGTNRNMQLPKETNMTTDLWPTEYSQDPTMRSRPCFSSHQTRELEREFSLCQYVTRRRRIELAYSLNLSEKQIKTWFQNRRVKERKQKKLSGDEKAPENSD